MKRKTLFLSAVLAAAATLPALAQEAYPARSVNAIVGFPPGGAADLVTRQLAESMRSKFPEGIVVVNRPGASGTNAIASLTRSRPDGYNFALVPNSNLTIGPQIQELSYGTPDDYVAVINVVSFAPVLVTRKESPMRSARDIAKAAQAAPGKISVGYPGEGTVSHLNAEAFKTAAKIQMINVPFAGWGQAAPALLGGHVDSMVVQPIEAVQQRESLNILGSFSKQRQAGLPDVPTFGEQGYDVALEARYLLIVPKGTPDSIVKYIHDAAQAAMDDPSFKEFVESRGMQPNYQDTGTVQAALWDEYKRYTPLLQETNLLKK